MHIHQLNFQYEADQDRLVARINTSEGLEIRLWLTRRLTLGFLPLLRKLTAEQMARLDAAQTAAGSGLAAKDPTIQALLSDFKKESVLQTSDFSTPYKESTNEPAFGDVPLLVNEISLSPLANGHLQVKFAGKLGDARQNREVKIDLDDKLMHGFLHLLEQSYVTSEWSQCVVAPLDKADPKSADATRPQYLN